MKINYAIIHAPGRQVDLAGLKIAIERSASFDDEADFITYCDLSPQIGLVPSMRQILHDSRVIGHDWIAIVQDDVIISHDIHSVVASTLYGQKRGVYSAYLCRKEERMTEAGWYQDEMEPSADNTHPWSRNTGACFLIFHRTAAKALCELPPPKRIDRAGWWVRESCYHLGIPYFFRYPSLVQHVGEKSLIHGGVGLTDDRVSHCFCDGTEGES